MWEFLSCCVAWAKGLSVFVFVEQLIRFIDDWYEFFYCDVSSLFFFVRRVTVTDVFITLSTKNTLSLCHANGAALTFQSFMSVLNVTMEFKICGFSRAPL